MACVRDRIACLVSGVVGVDDVTSSATPANLPARFGYISVLIESIVDE